ncbi:hypothetical protein GGC03_00165 [Vibrio sp. THAF191c]|nr:hypothetical protein FIU99_00165 [Vibrio sp. THAF64]QGM32754.1 hypothetical protein GGC04_00165 [Vibrio sp. THAF191d]QGN68257.1 hypothetical protein GGC03_00165 [Vibrio sp. THAF191c]
MSGQLCERCRCFSGVLFIAYKSKGISKRVCPRCCLGYFKTCSICKKHRKIYHVTHNSPPQTLCKVCIENPIFTCPKCLRQRQRHSKKECSDCYNNRSARVYTVKCSRKIDQRWLKVLLFKFYVFCTRQRGSLFTKYYLKKHLPFFQKIDKHVPSYSILGYWLRNALTIDELRKHLLIRKFFLKQGIYKPWSSLDHKKHQVQQSIERLLAKDSPHRLILNGYSSFLSTKKRLSSQTRLLYLRAANQYLITLANSEYQIMSSKICTSGYKNSLSIFLSWLKIQNLSPKTIYYSLTEDEQDSHRAEAHLSRLIRKQSTN